MARRWVTACAMMAIAFGIGVFVGQNGTVQAQNPDRIFEIRTYTAGEGKLDAVVDRFRDPEAALFAKHGMDAILYSVAAEEHASQNAFVYVLAHENRETARRSWEGFLAEPEFRAAVERSNVGGRAVVQVQSIFVKPTDFSPLR